MVNKYSGRSFNDLAQYPIFPWVISEYSVDYETLKNNLSNEIGYRDLTLNTGVLTEEKQKYAKELYDKEEDLGAMLYGKDKYHLKFGFSNKMICLAFLNRIEPYTDSFL